MQLLPDGWSICSHSGTRRASLRHHIQDAEGRKQKPGVLMTVEPPANLTSLLPTFLYVREKQISIFLNVYIWVSRLGY